MPKSRHKLSDQVSVLEILFLVVERVPTTQIDIESPAELGAECANESCDVIRELTAIFGLIEAPNLNSKSLGTIITTLPY